MKETIDCARNLMGLRRIEGQIHGIQRMIEDRKCTFNILTQVYAVKGALTMIEGNILAMYLQHRTAEAAIETPREKQKTIDEIIKLIRHTRKG
jgi:DNA-binding FrmR family transcriptional regulator